MSTQKSIFSSLQNDLPASVVVFFVALPLCLGIALASGAPLFSGIIAGVVGGIIVGSISNSSVGVSGPAAGLTVIVLSSIERLGGFELFLVAVVIAGIIQVVLGVIKAGTIAAFFPSSVVKGMLSAIGIIIILKQIPHAVGYDADYEGDMSFFQPDGENTFTELITMLDGITPGALLICAISLLIVLAWDNQVKHRHPLLKVLPGPFIAVVVGIAYHLVSQKFFPVLSIDARHLVQVPVSGNVQGFIHHLTFPAINNANWRDIGIASVTIAIVASLESLISVEATDKLDPQFHQTNTNRELIAQGAGNIVSGLVGGLPITQVILRSSANINSGAKSKVSAILHGVLLLTCVTSIPTILNLIPLSVLAAILLVIGFKLMNPQAITEMYKKGWSQFLPFAATIIGVVITDLLIGLGVGVAVSLVFLLRSSYLNSHFLKRDSVDGRKIRLTLAEEVFFLNKGAIIRELESIPEGGRVVIDMSKSVHIDEDVRESIANFRVRANTKNIEVELIERKSANEEFLEPINL